MAGDQQFERLTAALLDESNQILIVGIPGRDVAQRIGCGGLAITSLDTGFAAL